jgi:hypothetical protein
MQNKFEIPFKDYTKNVYTINVEEILAGPGGTCWRRIVSSRPALSDIETLSQNKPKKHKTKKKGLYRLSISVVLTW